MKNCSYSIPLMLIIRITSHSFNTKFLDRRSGYQFIGAAEALILAFIFISLFLLLILQKKHSMYTYIYLLITLLILIIVQHRSVLVAITITSIFICLWFYKSSPKLLISLIIIFTITLFFINTSSFYMTFIQSINNSLTFLSDPYKDASGSWRLTGWTQRLKQVWEKDPVFGEGLGGYSEWYVGNTLLRVAVHNGYIMNFAKFGLLGIFLLLGTILCWYKEMITYVIEEIDINYRYLGYVTMFCVLAHCVFTFFYEFTIFFWIFLGIGTVLKKQSAYNFNDSSEN